MNSVDYPETTFEFKYTVLKNNLGNKSGLIWSHLYEKKHKGRQSHAAVPLKVVGRRTR